MCSVTAIGNLTQDPQLRKVRTEDGQYSVVAEAGFAVNKRTKTDYQWKEVTCFISLLFWHRLAEKAMQLRKGQTIFIEGEIDYSQWEERKNGKTVKRSRHRIKIHRVAPLSWIPTPIQAEVREKKEEPIRR